MIEQPARRGPPHYEAARVERTRKMVLGARDNTDRFHGRELRIEKEARRYLEREWSKAPIRDRYHWLYTYEADEVAV
ncbi:hypothetical protein J3S89_20280 [Pinisolibacter sp. B13]|uniref:hypothetical protein n=1 Tax=Pinisolibacter aquiterrae TaxID=2815579 RepID=UPI001C3DACBF|nr:hypothetical protein [Pinisolibacter aquiterrae]MBV5266400.1 hypothetical protein [Pinisolibacter aquiterrae]